MPENDHALLDFLCGLSAAVTSKCAAGVEGTRQYSCLPAHMAIGVTELIGHCSSSGVLITPRLKVTRRRVCRNAGHGGSPLARKPPSGNACEILSICRIACPRFHPTMNILMIDVGGSNVKLMASGHEGRRKVPSGPKLTAAQMAKEVLKATEDWDYEAISLGCPWPASAKAVQCGSL